MKASPVNDVINESLKLGKAESTLQLFSKNIEKVNLQYNL